MAEQNKKTPGARVEVRNLTKKFGDLLVLDDISFNVEKGEFFMYCRSHRVWKNYVSQQSNETL